MEIARKQVWSSNLKIWEVVKLMPLLGEIQDSLNERQVSSKVVSLGQIPEMDCMSTAASRLLEQNRQR